MNVVHFVFLGKGPCRITFSDTCLLPINRRKVTSSLLQRHYVLFLRLWVRINMPHLLKKADLEELRVQFQFHFRSVSPLLFFQMNGTGEISEWHRRNKTSSRCNKTVNWVHILDFSRPINKVNWNFKWGSLVINAKLYLCLHLCSEVETGLQIRHKENIRHKSHPKFSNPEITLWNTANFKKQKNLIYS